MVPVKCQLVCNGVKKGPVVLLRNPCPASDCMHGALSVRIPEVRINRNEGDPFPPGAEGYVSIPAISSLLMERRIKRTRYTELSMNGIRKSAEICCKLGRDHSDGLLEETGGYGQAQGLDKAW
jgi:hypothetical protein